VFPLTSETSILIAYK